MRAVAVRQAGISLVEIMIALVLSLLLVGGAIQVYLSSKQSYRSQEGYARLQENGRYALEIMATQLRMAGYRATPWQSTSAVETVFPTDTTFTTAGQVLAGTEGGTSTSPPPSDSLSLRYQGASDGTSRDCVDASVSANTLWTNAFSVDTGRLMCNTQPLIDGVDSLQVLYGVDTDSPPDLYANKYRTAAQVTASAEWNSVVSVRIGLLLNTTENVSGEADTATFNLLGTAIPAPASTSTDRFMRRHAFTTTVSLRNRTP